MHHEFAIDPQSITQDYIIFCNIIKQFGFDKGRLVSAFPPKWFNKVKSSLSKNFSEQEIKTAIELLNRNICIKTNRQYDSTLEVWSDAAYKAHLINPFHALITDNITHKKSDDILSTKSLIGIEPQKFVVHTEIDILKKAEEFAKATKLLISNSKEILFIDPFFNSKYYFRPLCFMLSNIPSPYEDELNLKCFTKASREFESLETKIKKLQNLHRYIPRGLHLQVFFLTNDVHFRIHNRFVITEHGGIKFPDGLNEIDNAKDTINIMGEAAYLTKYKEFDEIDSSAIAKKIVFKGTYNI